ncbi:MAG: hypothetical protein SGILL_003509 [Bacillariaceae sp.]
MAALCHALMKYINHKDKEVRLYTVSCCIELFTLYAPEAPWTTDETLEIFNQTIRQLGNLAHTTSTKQPHFYDYYRILDLLAEVKIPVLLVDLYKVNDDKDRRRRNKKKKKSSRRRQLQASQDTLDTISEMPSDSDDDSSDEDDHHTANQTSQEALQVLTNLFRTLLGSVRNEHPREILDYCEKIMTSSIQEFFDTSVLPVPILDELLLAVGQGRTVLVLQQPQQQQPQQTKSKRRGAKKAPPAGAPVYAPQLNPSYLVASAVVRHNVERLCAPIATLLNGLVNNDARSIGESTLTTQLEEYRDSSDASDLSPNFEDEKRRNSRGSKDKPKTTPAEQAILDLAKAIGEPQPQQQDSRVTSHAWNIIYNLQVVEPSTLTTVIGNLASNFETTDFGQRVMVTQTLGKLFRGHQRKDSSNLTMAVEYNPCFRQWLSRSADKRLEIRQLMLPHLIDLAKACPDPNATGSKVELVREVHVALFERLSKDPSSDFRKTLIQQLSNVAYGHRRVLPANLMREIGTRVMSKNKDERKDALTGLVQTYFKQFMKYHLGSVLEGGDDCPIEVVLNVLDKCCRSSPADAKDQIRLSLGKSPKGKDNGRKRRISRRGKGDDDDDSDDDDFDMDEHERSRQDDFDYYQWIPSILFEAASFTDSIDAEMHSRVIMLVDELVLGCELRGPEDRKHLTSTARAVGLAVVVDGVRNQSHLAWHWMGALLDERAKLQTTLKEYIDARADIRNHVTGSEDYLAADSKAMDLLEKIASLLPAPGGPAPAQGERHPILEKFHSIRDKHVFRILGTITHPNHSVSARIRALNDLPKRVKATAGDAVQKWVVSLVQRCAMGDFLNQDVVHHCVVLAHECLQEDDWDSTNRFLTCAEMAASRFPALCASEQDYTTLSEMFRDCSGVSSSSSKKKKHMDKSNILTLLSSILAMASPHRAIGNEPSPGTEDIQKQLMKLCRDGTPEQARHSTATMVALLRPKEGHVLTQEQHDAFLPLLQTLASPSNLTVATENSSTKIICVLVALTELAENAPKIFETDSRGKRALKFALESVLMGRARPGDNRSSSDESSDESEDDDDVAERKTPKGRRSTKSKKSLDVVDHLSPSGSKSLVDDDNLSICCRTLCAAIEFLTSFVRSNIFTSRKTKESLPQATRDSIEKLFDILSNIIRDGGKPPSSRDSKFFGLRQDRAALRQCAAVALFRLCDARLGVGDKFLTTERWHSLAGMLLDDEKAVRATVMEELGEMLTASGKYAAAMGQKAMSPRLRFLAFIVLCTDGDHNADHSTTNGNAANVGKSIQNIKGNATNCVEYLRHVYEIGAVQARANGEGAERQFQSSTKVSLMPEYAVPYAFHLLTYRRETPRASKSTTSNDDDDEYEVDDAAQRILQKRVKMLFEILFKTANGNNVSFLLQMAETMSRRLPKAPLDGAPDGENQSKLLKVCQVSREVLLSLVKRDDNLESFPGGILIPSSLFGKGSRKKRVIALEAGPSLDIIRVDQEGREDAKSDDNMGDESEDESVDAGPSPFANDSDGEDDSLPSPKKDDGTKASGGTPRSVATRESNTGILSNESSEATFESSPGEDASLGTRRRSTRSGAKRKSDASNASNDESVSPNQSKRSRPSLDSDHTTPNKSVHFSPDKPMEFDGLSPIAKDASPSVAGLSSVETKTRGTTPKSREPDLASTSRSPTPISGDSTAKTDEDEAVVEKRKSLPSRRRTRKLPSTVTGKENLSAGKKRKPKKSVPKAIKIVRKPSPKLKATKNVRKGTRGSSRKKKAAVDPFGFDG